MRAIFINEAFEKRDKEDNAKRLLYPEVNDIKNARNLYDAIEKNIPVPESIVKKIVDNTLDNGDVISLKKLKEIGVIDKVSSQKIKDKFSWWQLDIAKEILNQDDFEKVADKILLHDWKLMTKFDKKCENKYPKRLPGEGRYDLQFMTIDSCISSYELDEEYLEGDISTDKSYFDDGMADFIVKHGFPINIFMEGHLDFDYEFIGFKNIYEFHAKADIEFISFIWYMNSDSDTASEALLRWYEKNNINERIKKKF